MIGVVVELSYAKTKTQKALVKYRMACPISLLSQWITPPQLHHIFDCRRIVPSVETPTLLGGGFRYGGRSVTWGRVPNAQPSDASKIGDLEEMKGETGKSGEG